MGTRSLTIVKEGDLSSQDIIVMYRQYDGYPSGHGEELKSFLQEFNIVNGFNSLTATKSANGLECLAAQIVAHFKTGIGSFYLHPSGTRDCGEEYIYTIYQQDGDLMLRIDSGEVTFFGMPGTPQSQMPCIYQGTVRDFNPEEIDR